MFAFFCFYSEHLIIHGDKLELRNVTLIHDGVYQCAVENKHGMIASATWVYIRGKYIHNTRPVLGCHGCENYRNKLRVLYTLTPNIKEQILLSCPHTFLLKVLGRSY